MTREEADQVEKAIARIVKQLRSEFRSEFEPLARRLGQLEQRQAEPRPSPARAAAAEGDGKLRAVK